LEIYGLKFALKQYCCLLMANQRNAAGWSVIYQLLVEASSTYLWCFAIQCS
jgi:hypothetical protein